MGTQQILLIVLSVIIVGVAIAVGITMFNNNAYNQNKSAVSSELNSYASQVVQWYKTPIAQGGRGGGTLAADATAVPAIVAATEAEIAAFIGFSGANLSLTTPSGEYRVSDIVGETVILVGKGKEAKGTNFPFVETIITFPAGTITATTADLGAAVWEMP